MLLERCLTPFTSVPGRSVCVSLRVVDIAAAAWLQLDYRVAGMLPELLLPAATEPLRCDGLWQHSCFELFVAAAGSCAYREFNFSPSRQWAAYDFSDYREALPLPLLEMPSIRWQQDASACRLQVALPFTVLASMPSRYLQLGLSAVLEDRSGSLEYWALRHAGERPDFHHRDGFAITIAVPQLREP